MIRETLTHTHFCTQWAVTCVKVLKRAVSLSWFFGGPTNCFDNLLASEIFSHDLRGTRSCIQLVVMCFGFSNGVSHKRILVII